ncbi:hypothetical protein [Phaffia rhodozyma]|uniref:Uncharacterized protein n=1 Tax=Phaffia rhodozyma TaxID=264483 RepID=A0A0F7SPP5_PHARH|nr:hypothetical protein [Phaffia rhodozyma]
MSLNKLVELLMVSSISLVRALPSAHYSENMMVPRATSAYADAVSGGGSMLTIVSGTYPAGLGEPLNIIISGSSDTDVLVDALTDGGFQNYAQSLNFSTQCLDSSLTNSTGQQANLGDGQNVQTEIATFRYNYGDTFLGACKESIVGGNHFRYWKQANTDAYFLAASVEMNLTLRHDIQPNGYNLGRDWFVGNASSHTVVDTHSLTNGSYFEGTSSSDGYTYRTKVNYVSGLLANSSDSINHADTVSVNGLPAIDGLVAVLTVTIDTRPSGSDASPSSSSTQSGSLRMTSVPKMLGTLNGLTAGLIVGIYFGFTFSS